MESPTNERKEKKKLKRIKRLFEDIHAGAVIQVERRISKVIRALKLLKNCLLTVWAEAKASCRKGP